MPWNMSMAVMDNITQPISSFQALAAVDSPDMRCNGRADLCDLRYNQVTYPATHNSAAYDLKYDCALATETCLQTKTVCTAQAQNCTKGWETRCTKMSNSCQDRLPKWMHWLCGAFSSVCESTEQFCLGWEQICTSSLEVCTLWGSACLDVIPNWAVPCLWDNQPGHPILQQLNDGIRFLDLGTCLINNGTQIVMCHGYGATRAIGVTLDSVMSQILEFMLANPYEVLTIEFNQNDGDAGVMSKFIVAKILQYFTLPTGQLMMWPRKSLSDPWPKLRDMILSNQRIMIFMGDTYWSIPDPKPEWANHKDTWKLDGFRYTSEDSQPAELNQSYYNWCTKGPPTDGSYVLWQQMDINLGILKDDILRSLKEGKIPQLCIGPLAVQTNSALLDALADYCYSKWPYWYRVRVNHYWEGNLFPVVNRYNDMNVARVKAGDSITPF
ncbi:PLC-like phosphodiesterase [Lobosporangium transversale]|uniref:PLC-like phosphodiesterase n=1 Tax=Lobosporangium transversale TaxID=64571 RepID=A0A1Y2GLP9_9FUNG|nr:PLC-like phosphodiesterase [Lobosporangium transversale]ORZ14842.1 PLC-like phosphodiesterase [Lobosporangium transversale]|eukprot:XP_021880974.1 PLC-like phosphodiesterase [Lobosporangium transversale]